MAAILRSGRTFKPEVVPEIESHTKIGHAIPYILRFCSTFLLKYWRSYGYFKIRTTFWPRDLVIWHLTYKNYRVLCCRRLHIWTKFGDDWSKTATCIAENVTISFKHEYRRPTLTSRCDVIRDVINIKSTYLGLILDGLSISNVKMNLSKIFRNFQNGRNFEVRRTFRPEVIPEVGDAMKIGLDEYYVVVL